VNWKNAMEQHRSESDSESELDSEEEDAKELVSKWPCTSAEQHSKPKQKKQKVSITRSPSKQVIKLIDNA
jgi:hypothetical protein